MARLSIPKALNRGCLALFLTPFAGFGIFALVRAVRSFQSGEMPRGEAIGMIAFGVLFTAIPIGTIVLTIIGSKRKKKKAEFRKANSEAPWLWKPEWVEGRIRSGSRAAVIAIWLFALTFSGFCIPIVQNFFSPTGDKGFGAIVFGGLFILAACGMIYASLYMTVRWTKYGRSHLELVTNPGVVGGWFKGDIHSGLRPGPNDKINLRLTNARRYTTGSGDNRSTHTDVKWQEERKVSTEEIYFGGRGGKTRIPVAFYIPRDCQATTLEDSSDRMLWRLEVTAEVPGIDFKAAYEVPIFVTPESSDDVPPEAEELYALTQDQVVDYATRSKIRVRPAQGGGTEIYVPPRRTPGSATVVSIFATIFSAATLFLVSQGALFMALIFGLFSALMVWASLDLWFGTRTTVLVADAIHVHHKVIGRGKTHSVSKTDVEKVDIGIGMQSGDRAFYRVRLHLGGRKKHAIATGIRDKNEARWLVSVVESYLEAE